MFLNILLIVIFVVEQLLKILIILNKLFFVLIYLFLLFFLQFKNFLSNNHRQFKAFFYKNLFIKTFN